MAFLVVVLMLLKILRVIYSVGDSFTSNCFNGSYECFNDSCECFTSENYYTA